MREGISQSKQERDLALERDEAAQQLSKLLEEQEGFSEVDRQWDPAKQSFMSPEFSQNVKKVLELKIKVKTVDAYTSLAAASEDMDLPQIEGLADIEVAKQEKAKLEAAIEKLIEDIGFTQSELNKMRKKLGLPETAEIPILVDKKWKLENLTAIQRELESKIDFETKKQAAQSEDDLAVHKQENSNLQADLENISHDLRQMLRGFEQRSSNGYSTLFSHEEELPSLALKFRGDLNREELAQELGRLGDIFGESAPSGGGVRDNVENLYHMISSLRQLSAHVRELPQRLQFGEERKSLSRASEYAAEHIDGAAAKLAHRAHAIEAYHNVRLP